MELLFKRAMLCWLALALFADYLNQMQRQKSFSSLIVAADEQKYFGISRAKFSSAGFTKESGQYLCGSSGLLGVSANKVSSSFSTFLASKRKISDAWCETGRFERRTDLKGALGSNRLALGLAILSTFTAVPERNVCDYFFLISRFPGAVLVVGRGGSCGVCNVSGD